MAKRLFPIVAVILVIALAWFVYQRWVNARATDTSIHMVDPTAGADANDKILVDKVDSDPLHRDLHRDEQKVDKTIDAIVAQPHDHDNALPAGDTIPVNPPNDMKFVGTGRYELYRQGNLTWRMDTDNGHACIIFATDEEWRKPRVYSNGCGND